jgi:hypothetical protein
MKTRLTFSINPINQEKKLLLFGLVLMVGVSFALGFRDAAQASGELIPTTYKQKITDSITGMAQAQIERQSELIQNKSATVLQNIQQGLNNLWMQADTLLAPYASYIAFGFGALLVWLLNTLLGFVAWLPLRLLNWFIWFLKGIGVMHEVVETMEVQRLVLD